MSTSRRRGIPTPLENVRRRFERWRRTRTVRARIPEPLWAAAVKMAGQYGVHQTAKALRIDYYGLKKRAQAEGVTSTRVPAGGEGTAFVEFPGSLAAPVGECLVELEDVGGAKMRVQLRGVAPPDLVALSRSFWDAVS
jgi:hypothetical protein